MNEEALLETYGWVTECSSPYELRHDDGSFATGQAASIVVEAVRQEFLDELIELDYESAIFRCKNINCDYRVIKRDGDSYPVGADLDFSRINLELENNKVKKAFYG